MSIAWPGRRADVVAGLEVLAAEPPPAAGARDRRWPPLTDAVHWVVDDTWWDQRPPADDIGTILRDRAEADALAAVVAVLVGVLDEVGPDDDAAVFAHPRWAEVRRAAVAALDLVRGDRAT